MGVLNLWADESGEPSSDGFTGSGRGVERAGGADDRVAGGMGQQPISGGKGQAARGDMVDASCRCKWSLSGRDLAQSMDLELVECKYLRFDLSILGAVGERRETWWALVW